LAAADVLAGHGISATVWDPRIVQPPDPAMIEDASRHPLVVTIEDGLRNGGAGDNFRDKIESHLHATGADAKSCAIRVLGLPRTYVPHDKPAAILARHGLDSAGIVTEIRQTLA